MAIDPSSMPAADAKPRVAIFSLRAANDHVSAAGGYVFEDIVTHELDTATLLTPRPLAPPKSALARQAVQTRNWLRRHALIGRNRAPDLTPVHLEDDVDLFFYHAATPRSLNALHAVKGWREHSGFAICWLQEIWATSLPHLGGLVDVLNKFDHVICPLWNTFKPLRALLDVPVSYLPAGVDTELFCPFPTPPPRVIDITNIGGLDPQTHEELIDYAARTGKYYAYGTIRGHHGMASHRAHRRNYADQLKRSRYFLSYMAKVTFPEQRGPQEEFGPRYIEGVAAGAVLLGDRLRNPGFEEYLGWEDSVIEAPYPSHGITRIIDALEADPQRVAAIRRRNILQALRRHDHLHRWGAVLDIAGLDPTPGMAQRQIRLNDLIERVGNAPDSDF